MDTNGQKTLQLRNRLLARGAELCERVLRLRSDLRREREPLPGDSADAAIVCENDEILEAIEESALVEIHHIDRALQRLDDGDYGVCERCGAEIAAPRLRAVPYATRCQRCAAD